MKRRVTGYAIGEGTTENAFRAALGHGPLVFTTGDAGKCRDAAQKNLGDDATVSIWGFDVWIDPNVRPNYWNA